MYIYIYIYVCVCIYIYIYIYIVILMVITTYHAVYWSYRASRTDTWFPPCSIPRVPGLPEVAHSMTEDPEDRGYRSTRISGQWVMRRWRQKLPRAAVPAHPYIFYGGPEEDIGHMRLLCAQETRRWRGSCVSAWRSSLRSFP